MTYDQFNIGDRVRIRPGEGDRELPHGHVGTVVEADGKLGIIWRVLVDWNDAHPPIFLDTSRLDHAD